jgi:hypothetical protein
VEALAWILILLLAFAILSFIAIGLAAITIFMGPPDMHDVDINDQESK